LIDQFVRHITQWLLAGTDYTANWAPAGLVLAADPNNMDITNNYIAQAVQGGIWQLALFLAIIVGCFKIVGQLVRGNAGGVLTPRMRWALGIALSGHCVAFLDISYFDQISVFWYWLVAVIACLSVYVAEGDSRDASPDPVHPAAELTPALERLADGAETAT
jgi:hypothetical protein